MHQLGYNGVSNKPVNKVATGGCEPSGIWNDEWKKNNWKWERDWAGEPLSLSRGKSKILRQKRREIWWVPWVGDQTDMKATKAQCGPSRSLWPIAASLPLISNYIFFSFIHIIFRIFLFKIMPNVGYGCHFISSEVTIY